MPKSSFDISNENFDYYFQNKASMMQPNQKEQLPKDLVYKLFKKGHVYNTTATTKLSFLTKIFILLRVLKKRWILVVEDENGMSEEEYFKYKKLSAKRDYCIENGTKFISEGTFVLGGKELVDTYYYLNNLSISPAYNYLSKSKNKIKSKVTEWNTQMNFLARFTSNYESNRKKIAMKTGINMPEFMVLIYIYHGAEVVSSDIWKNVYVYSFNSSATKIKLAFGSLQNKGYIEKIGVSKGTKIKITPLGKDKMNEIMNKYLVNC